MTKPGIGVFFSICSTIEDRDQRLSWHRRFYLLAYTQTQTRKDGEFDSANSEGHRHDKVAEAATLANKSLLERKLSIRSFFFFFSR